jgi:hypothetical protein
MRVTRVALLVGVLAGPVSAAHAQTWLTDPAFGARRDAYGPGVNMDATGRAYHDRPSNAWIFEPVQPNAYGPGVGSDTLGRPVVPAYEPRGRGFRDRVTRR